MADARTQCPQCGGAVHPVAGRCKHCKADLVALRGDRVAPAPVGLPPFVGTPPARRDDTPPPVLPPRPAALTTAPHRSQAPGRAALPEGVRGRSARWPLVVIGLSVVAIATAVGVMVWPTGSAAGADPDRGKPADPPPPPPKPAQPALSRDLVKPPVATDLEDYTGHLPRYGALRANIDTTLGTIHCELFPERAPIAVANFVGLATGKKPWLDANGTVQRGKPFYDGLTFHRVIPEFMIQGGDPLATGTGGPGYKFGNEVQPDLKMVPGALAMANSGPDTNGSQFFIAEIAADWLDGKHTIFGKCDLAVVQRIARVAKSSSDKPVEPITMTVTISR